MQSQPTPPPTPDPVATAAAQTQGDVQSAIANSYLGNANEVSPLGNVNYNQTGSVTIKDAQGKDISVPQFTRTTTLSPSQQALYDQQTKLGTGLNNLAISQVGKLDNLLGTPLDTSGLPQIKSTVGASPTFQQQATSFSAGTQPMQYGYDAGGNIQKSVNLNTNAPTSFGDTAGNIQYKVGADDFTKDRDTVVQALMSRLQPSIDRDRLGLEQRLTNQGISQGSEAWNRAIDASTRQANDAYMQATLAGSQEQSRLFGMDVTKGQFNNSAQNQDYSQLLGRGQFEQAGIGQNNAATLGMGQFANSAQAQANGQNAALAAFSNSAQNQQFGQNQAAAQFGNTAIGNNNATAQQGYQNAVTDATFNNSAAAQALQQALALRNQPINEISALMAGGQVSMPQFQQYNGANIAGSTLGQNTYASAGLQNQQYQTQAQAAAQNNAGLYSLMGSVAGAGGYAYGKSDRRVKRDITRVGTTDGGFPLYKFRYIGEPELRIGVMADEVEKVMPEAVREFDGIKHVNYAMVT